MSTASAIGTFLPANSRMWRNPAHLSEAAQLGFASVTRSCQPEITASAPPSPAGVVYHFRTPSPGGQQTPRGALLPVFFCLTSRVCPVRGGDHRRNRAQAHRLASDCLTARVTAPTLCPTTKGCDPCQSNPLPSYAQQPLALRPAETRLANKPSSAVPSVQVPQPSPAAALSLVPPLGPRATSFTVKPIPAAAGNSLRLTRIQSIPTQHRSANRRGGVLRLSVPTREASCSKSC